MRLKISYNRQQHQVDVDDAATLGELQEKLEALSGIQPPNQKLVFKGMKREPMSEPTSPLVDVGLSDGSKIMLVGTAAETEEQLKKAEQAAKRREASREVARRSLATSSTGDPRDRIRSAPSFGFGRLQVLTELENQPSVPSPAEAMKLLQRISSDPGVLHIMNKYQWNVGVLKEFAPSLQTGIVGVSDRCLLGYNENKGQAIALRLRTDDFASFRHYHMLMATVLHELTHMVHSDHDANFYALNRQLEQEYKAFMSGQSLAGGPRAPISFTPDERTQLVGGTYRLGGSQAPKPRSAAQAAGEAALLRLTELERIISQGCANAPGPDPEASAKQEGTASGVDMDIVEAVPDVSKAQTEPDNEAPSDQRFTEPVSPRQLPQPQMQEQQPQQEETSDATRVKQGDSDMEDTNIGTDLTDQDMDVDDTVEALAPDIKDEIYAALLTIYGQYSHHTREMIRDTIMKIFGNILRHPEEGKYRRINVGGKLFTRVFIETKTDWQPLFHACGFRKLSEEPSVMVFDQTHLPNLQYAFDLVGRGEPHLQ